MSKNASLEKATLLNSKRLLADAVLLKRRKRWHSSVAVTVQALEEFGKALILRWDVKNDASKRKFPTHVEKQAATFALLSADELLAKKGKLLNRFMNCEGVDFSNVGPYSEQFAFARSGFYENIRLTVTYQDEEPIYSSAVTDTIGPEFVSELINYVKKARLAARNPEAMNLASIFYANDLGRL